MRPRAAELGPARLALRVIESMAGLRHTFFVDASYDYDRRIAGIGVVMRATEKPGRRPGPIAEKFSEAYLGIPPGAAEKFAVLRALEIAAAHSATRVKVRSDCSQMRTRLKLDHGRGVGLDRHDLHGSVLRLAATFQEVKFSFVQRRRNQEAHRLARMAVREGQPAQRPDIFSGTAGETASQRT